MQYSQKYTLASFFRPIDIGTKFHMADWPMHITLADVFAVRLNGDVLQKLAEFFQSKSPFYVTVGEDAILGETSVVLIEKDERLQDLHNQIIKLLELNGATFNMPEYTKEGFLPHVTVQGVAGLRRGDTIEISSVSLIDMFPNEDWRQRKVIGNYGCKKNYEK